MEELRSTAALDREILEDARKKADRILKGADQASASAIDTWKNKADADIVVLERKHAERIAARRGEIMARLPLDKRRARTERAERLLQGAMDSFLGSLPREKLLALVSRELAARGRELPKNGLSVVVGGLDEGEVESLLVPILPSGSWTLTGTIESPLPSIAIEGGRVRVRISVAEIADELLSERRAELAVALLGKEAAND